MIHLQWTQPIIQGTKSLRAALLASIRFKRSVRLALHRGVGVVWTVHNKLPHEINFPRLEKSLNRFLAKHAKKVHIMNRETAAVVRSVYTLDPQKSVYIPHPSYATKYPDTVTSLEARNKLGISPHVKVILFLGNIRPYKGIERLVEAHREMVKEDPTIVLLVAGRIDKTMENFLKDSQSTSPNLVVVPGLVPEGDIQLFMRSADVCVFPFSNVLNSGSIALAGTYGKRVVTTSQLALEAEYLNDPWVTFFEEGNNNSLVSSITAALASPPSNEEFEPFLQRSSPDRVSLQFLDVLVGTSVRE